MDEAFVSMVKDNGLSIEVPPRPRCRLQQPTRIDEFLVMKQQLEAWK